ncbi:MAG TPA: nucleotidyl transferase AbiEii/AbiGii toxin family protein [Vicinamibacteria bacterium]|nr:nucleotidyl transferase AbiEii/AbiGii toxin family protein [Vicinamibacteria bacterium]
MNPAILRMLQRYSRDTIEENVAALREILQQLALLGLWRSKFFEQAVFYGGTALRMLYGLDRYSDDLDFSLLAPDADFSLSKYGSSLERELAGFGFEVSFAPVQKSQESAIESAFIKTNTLKQMVLIEADRKLLASLQSDQKLKIRLEVDVDPPGGFEIESKPILQPVPFAVRVYTLPDLFAGKMHALLCRRWRNRVKGRDWYDFVWYVSNYPRLHLSHLEQRMRQSGDYTSERPLDGHAFQEMVREAAKNVDIERAREEVLPFVLDQSTVEIWSEDFFSSLIDRVEFA